MSVHRGPVDPLGVPWEAGSVLVTLYLMTCFQIGLMSLILVCRAASFLK